MSALTLKRRSNAAEIAYQMSNQPYKLSITRRAYYVDAMTGSRVGVLVRNFNLIPEGK